MSRTIERDSAQDSSPRPADLYGRVREQLENHPYRTLAIAASVGFVLGGGMLGRVAGKLVATGLRAGLAAYAAPLAAQLFEQLRMQTAPGRR